EQRRLIELLAGAKRLRQRIGRERLGPLRHDVREHHMIGCAPVARRPSRKPEKAAKPPKRRRPGRPPKHETDDAEARFPDAHVIKRYGNRRLYDAENSRAITLE